MRNFIRGRARVRRGHPWVQDGATPDKPLDSAVFSGIKKKSAINKIKKMALRAESVKLSAGLDDYYESKGVVPPVLASQFSSPQRTQNGCTRVACYFMRPTTSLGRLVWMP